MNVDMNAAIVNSIAGLRRRFAQAASLMLLIGIVWQSMALGADASNFLTGNSSVHNSAHVVAASVNSMNKQVSCKVDRIKGAAEESMGRVDQVKGAAKDSMGRAQSKMENSGGDVKRNMNKTKAAVGNAADKAGDSAENAVDAVKEFFGQ